MSIFDFKTLMEKIKAYLSSILDNSSSFYSKSQTFLIILSCFLKNKKHSNNFATFNLN